MDPPRTLSFLTAAKAGICLPLRGLVTARECFTASAVTCLAGAGAIPAVAKRSLWTDTAMGGGDTLRLMESTAPERVPEDSTYLSYTRTPFAKRVPIVAALALPIVVAFIVGFSVAAWLGIVTCVVLIALSLLFLRRVLGLEWERIVKYREFDKP